MLSRKAFGMQKIKYVPAFETTFANNPWRTLAYQEVILRIGPLAMLIETM